MLEKTYSEHRTHYDGLHGGDRGVRVPLQSYQQSIFNH